MIPDLQTYDWIVVSSSGGKDSQTTLDVMHEECQKAGVVDRMVVAHANLGKIEWPGASELAEKQARHYEISFHTKTRKQGDLLDHVLQRGKWPSSDCRYCTSDHKRDQIARLFSELAGKMAAKEVLRRMNVLHCMGMRADESPARRKLKPFQQDDRNTCSFRQVDTFLPIHAWSVEQVWERIKSSKVPHHVAYDLGMPRLSCVFCIFSPKAALMVAGKHNPELLNEYVEVEAKIGHTFKKNFRIAEIKAALDAGEVPGEVKDWVM